MLLNFSDEILYDGVKSTHNYRGNDKIQSYNENVFRDTVSQIVPWRLSIPDMASVSGFVSRWRQSM